MKRERILAEVETVAEAKKAEETVKTGYAEASVETILNWIGVEEDLASSYEHLAAKPENASKKGTLQQLARESRDNIASLTALRKAFEDLDRARVARINLLASMNP
jgi:hypothetical protein